MSISNFTNFPRKLRKLVNHEVPRLAYVERVSDTDSIVVVLDRNFYDSSLKRLRIRGIYAEENSTASGKLGTEFLKDLLPPGTPVVVTTFKSTYDRYEATVLFEFAGGIADLGEVIVKAGFATREKPKRGRKDYGKVQ